MHTTLQLDKLKKPVWVLKTGSLGLKLRSYMTYLSQLATDHPRLTAWGKVVLVFTLFFIVCFGTLDPDFGWHLQAGNYFRAHGIPSHDVFSYTARNFPWIDHEWGNDVLTSYLYQFGGYVLLSLVFAGLWTLGLMINALRVRLIFILMAIAAMIPYVVIRPTVWDVLGLSILINLLVIRKSSKAIWWLPLIFLVWANLHGGFILGLAVVFYFALIKRSRSLLLMGLACTLVSFINPYGPRLYVEIFRTLTDLSLHGQTEGMASLAVGFAAWPLIALWGAGLWSQGRKQFLAWMGLSPLLLLASFVATRNLPLFVVVATPELNNYYTQVKKLIPKQLPRYAKKLFYIMTLAILGLTIYIIYPYAIPTSNRDANYPVAAVAYLKNHPCTGSLFNDFNFGGYLIWKLPSVPVFIDGRMASWRNPQGEKYLDIYLNAVNDPSVRQTVFKQYDITCALVQNNVNWSVFISQLKAQGWQAPVVANQTTLLVAPR
ncbi:MAG TPA: hypothetical protein VMR95_03725 [Candidatus Binatia bacterium]|nr:hypothetical protein [Candidatus Binatia bacterium]